MCKHSTVIGYIWKASCRFLHWLAILQENFSNITNQCRMLAHSFILEKHMLKPSVIAESFLSTSVCKMWCSLIIFVQNVLISKQISYLVSPTKQIFGSNRFHWAEIIIPFHIGSPSGALASSRNCTLRSFYTYWPQIVLFIFG